MLRKSDNDGWLLITHPDHARLAGDFAEQWGNELFPAPSPRTDVLEAVFHHDDGWAARDRQPQITRQGQPSAFSVDLVGKYSAFEEIDLVDYLAVRSSALEIISTRNAYAAVLISMHTCNLLADRADYSTIAARDLPLLQAFLAEQRSRQADLRRMLQEERGTADANLSEGAFLDNFHFLQACDCLSLLSCVDYAHPTDLLHDLLTHDGGRRRVKYFRKDQGVYTLDPFPFRGDQQQFSVPYRRVRPSQFASSAELTALYSAAAPENLTLTFLRA
jgi:hypothetical protein